jgi:hypothetical protein
MEPSPVSSRLWLLKLGRKSKSCAGPYLLLLFPGKTFEIEWPLRDNKGWTPTRPIQQALDYMISIDFFKKQM